MHPSPTLSDYWSRRGPTSPRLAVLPIEYDFIEMEHKIVDCFRTSSFLTSCFAKRFTHRISRRFFLVALLVSAGCVVHLSPAVSGPLRNIEHHVAEQKAIQTSKNSIIEQRRIEYNISALSPNKPGRCWFHSQVAHKQDREIFTRLGGYVVNGSCNSARVNGARYSSEAEICTCIAPPASAFARHFLEIGSADGQYLSNLLFFEMQLNWRGICVEGSPTSFEELRVNRPDCATVNAAIGPSLGHAVFYTFDSPHSWEIGLSCMQGTQCGKNDHEAQQFADEHKLTLRKHNVPVRKLSDIFVENKMRKFGWIMIDVEGAEDIVVPTIDLSRVRADYISYETNNDIDHLVARDHLNTAGYEVDFTVGYDRFFVKT